MLRRVEGACPRLVRRISCLSQLALELIDEDREDLLLEGGVASESMVKIERHRQYELSEGHLRHDPVDEIGSRLRRLSCHCS